MSTLHIQLAVYFWVFFYKACQSCRAKFEVYSCEDTYLSNLAKTSATMMRLSMALSTCLLRSKRANMFRLSSMASPRISFSTTCEEKRKHVALPPFNTGPSCIESSRLVAGGLHKEPAVEIGLLVHRPRRRKEHYLPSPVCPAAKQAKYTAWM